MNPDKLPSRISTRLAVSGPAALGVLLLAGAIALGNSTGLFAAARDATTPGVAAASPGDEPSSEPAAPAAARQGRPAGEDWGPDELEQARDVAKPDAEVEPTPKPEPEAKPTPKPEQEPVWQPEPPKDDAPAYQPPPAAPPTTELTLSANLGEYPGKVVLTWSAFSGDGFGYYKLVRSLDGTVTWPPSGDDQLIGAFGSPGETWATDKPACGTTVFYRVFAVSKGDYGYALLAPSNAVSATVECPPPPPATEEIGFEVSFAEGAVHLAWGACATEHFNAYKVVRSQTNPNPTYPEGEGTELIAAIGDPNQTWFADESVESGQTWWYRVFARAENGGGTYIACQTQALSVTMP